MRGLALEQVHRRALGQVQQRGVFEIAFHLVVGPGAGIFPVVTEVLVESLVVLVLQLGLGAGPESAGLVQRLFLAVVDQHDGQAEVVGILLHQVAQAFRLQELLVFRAQVQDHLGAAVGFVVRLNLVGAFAVRIPAHAFGVAAPGQHADFLGDDKGGIEADAELADQLRVLGLVAAQGLEEFFGAGASDGAEVFDHLVAAHADAVVLDGQGAAGGVRDQLDAQGIAAQQFRPGQGLEAQLLAGIGGVGDQLAQEDFLVRVQRMDHQAQHLAGFCLEFPCFSRHWLV